jgi:Caspase domain
MVPLPRDETTKMQPLEDAHALIIGIADYNGIRKLPRVADARDLAAVLADRALCGYPKDNVQLIEDAQATNQAIRAGLHRLVTNAGPDDHGIPLFLRARGAN